MFEKNSSGFRQRNSVFRAIKKRHSEFLFQRFDLKCDCRLCEIESFGSLSEIQIIGNCAEDLQSEIFHFGSSCKPLSLSARCKWYLPLHPIGLRDPTGCLPTRKNRPCVMARPVSAPRLLGREGFLKVIVDPIFASNSYPGWLICHSWILYSSSTAGRLTRYKPSAVSRNVVPVSSSVILSRTCFTSPTGLGCSGFERSTT